MVATPPPRARRASSGVPAQDSDTPDVSPDTSPDTSPDVVSPDDGAATVPAPAEEPVAAPPVTPDAPAVAPVKPAPVKPAPVIAPVVAPPVPVAIPEPQPVTPPVEEPPEPPPMPREAMYTVEIRLQNAATTGESNYEVQWSASMVRAYLDDTLTKIRLPVRTHFGHDSPPNILRYVNMGFVGEILIHNWPDAANAPD